MGDCLIVRRGGGKSTFPTEISVTTPPTKTSYNAGESIDLTGMVVMATYSDGSTADVTSECSFSPASGAVVYEDTSKITITWSWEGTITYSTSQSITVTRVLSSIAITTKPTKTSYVKGEALSLSGMVVTASFSSGRTEAVTSYTSSPASGAALSTLGTTTVTVSYTENGATKTASFTVSVSVKTVTWAGGTDQEIADMVAAADAGVIKLSDYWAVGDTRSVSLSAMAANWDTTQSNQGESHAAQTVEFVIMDTTCTGFKVTSTGKTPSLIVGMKNCLTETGYMNYASSYKYSYNTNGWSGSARRIWCNGTFYNAVPEAFRSLFKQFTWKQGKGSGNTSGLLETNDYFALAPEKAIFGSCTYSFSDETALYSQWSWYQTSSNRIKTVNGSANSWWECSPYSGYSRNFCFVGSDGTANSNNANSTNGLAVFGCI